VKINNKYRCDEYFESYKEAGSEDSELSEGSADAVGFKIG